VDANKIIQNRVGNKLVSSRVSKVDASILVIWGIITFTVLLTEPVLAKLIPIPFPLTMLSFIVLPQKSYCNANCITSASVFRNYVLI
jgi:succinate-acetate transporter protein